MLVQIGCTIIHNTARATLQSEIGENANFQRIGYLRALLITNAYEIVE
jgi:hypothetical protein